MWPHRMTTTRIWSVKSCMQQGHVVCSSRGSCATDDCELSCDAVRASASLPGALITSTLMGVDPPASSSPNDDTAQTQVRTLDGGGRRCCNNETPSFAVKSMTPTRSRIKPKTPKVHFTTLRSMNAAITLQTMPHPETKSSGNTNLNPKNDCASRFVTSSEAIGAISSAGISNANLFFCS